MTPVTKQNMSPILVLFVFFACGVLMWKLITWLPPRLREPTMIITATAAIYAASFFLVGMFAVYMFVHLVGKYSHVLPQGFYYPVLILAIAMLIFVPGYATRHFYRKCRPRTHKPPTVRRLAGRKPPGGRGPLRF